MTWSLDSLLNDLEPGFTARFCNFTFSPRVAEAQREDKLASPLLPQLLPPLLFYIVIIKDIRRKLL